MSYNPAVPLLGASPDVHQKTCKKIFIVEPAIKALQWKQPECLITIKLINKMRYSHTMENNGTMRISDMTTCNNVDESHQYKFEQKEAYTKVSMLSDSIYIK